MKGIAGIICCPATVDNILKQMVIPQDTFIISNETELNCTMTVYEQLVEWSIKLSTKLNSDNLQGLIEFAGLKEKIDFPISKIAIVDQRKLLFLKAMLSCSHNIILNNFFEDLNILEAAAIKPLLVEVSTYAMIFLIGSSDIGFDLCDWIIHL